MTSEGHLLGNFHAYYSFNPVKERLRFMNEKLRTALRNAFLFHDQSESDADADADAATVLDVGCNEGLSIVTSSWCLLQYVGLMRFFLFCYVTK